MPSSHSLQGAILLLVCAWASIIHPHRASGALPGLEGYVAVPQVSPGVGEYLITLDRRLILNANEGRIQVIDLKTGTKLRTFGFEGRSVSAYGVSTDSATLDARLKTFDDQGVPIETGGELVAWRLVDGQRITQPSPPPVMLAPPDWQAWQKLHPNIKPGLDPRYGIEALPNNRDSEEERYALLDFKTGERRTFALLRDLSCVNDPQTFAYDGINLVLAHGGGEAASPSWTVRSSSGTAPHFSGNGFLVRRPITTSASGFRTRATRYLTTRTRQLSSGTLRRRGSGQQSPA